MKYNIWLVLLLSVSGCAFAQTNAPLHTWQVTLKVVDESGLPVVGANIAVGYFINSQPARSSGLTDTNGLFTASHSPAGDLNELGFTAEKTGYYTTRMGYTLFPPYDPIKWNINQMLVLKKIRTPIAMYAKYIRKNPPAKGQPIGYDLVVGDWVGIYGTGIKTDLFVQANDYRNSGLDYEHKVTITFPKPDDGIQTYTIPESEKGSDLRSPHEAPTNGYQSELVRENSAHPGQTAKNEYDPNRIYLFRVRTVKDNNGNIISAHYGKIYGDFTQFSYYLNPTPNDRNIEFDPKQNLLGGLNPLEQVNAP